MTDHHGDPGADAGAELFSQLLAELRDTNLPKELLAAVGEAGELDRHGLAITLLAVMAHASRAGCRARQVRRFVDLFVRETLTGARGNAVVDDCALRAARLVDAVYLTRRRADVEGAAGDDVLSLLSDDDEES
jgi:hypothetical protein